MWAPIDHSFYFGQRETEQTFSELLPILIVLACLAVVGGCVIFAVKRWSQGRSGSAGADFTWSDLHRLHEQGEISDDEYERARKRMAERLRSQLDEQQE